MLSITDNNPCHLLVTEVGLEEPMRTMNPAAASETKPLVLGAMC